MTTTQITLTLAKLESLYGLPVGTYGSVPAAYACLGRPLPDGRMVVSIAYATAGQVTTTLR